MKKWKLDVYQVIDDSDLFPYLSSFIGDTAEECEEKALEVYSTILELVHWTNPYETCQ